MDDAAIRLIQGDLKNLDLYAGDVDGIRGDRTDAAIEAALSARTIRLPADWQGWPAKRKAVALLQLTCQDEGIDSGIVDGWWGPQSDFAWDQLEEKRRTGALPPPFRDDDDAAVRAHRPNPQGFPTQRMSLLTEFYGPPGKPDGGLRPPMRKVQCPWTLRLAWNPEQTRSFIWCHERAADSLGEVLEKVHQTYGAETGRLGLDLFGGDYVPRKMRGGSAWSMHSWGIAIDWNPEKNRLKWGRDRATLAGSDFDDWWNAWEEHGWTSLGRARDFDWMHVQAAGV